MEKREVQALLDQSTTLSCNKGRSCDARQVSIFRLLRFLFAIFAIGLLLVGMLCYTSETEQTPEEPVIEKRYDSLEDILKLCTVYSDDCPHIFRGYHQMKFGYVTAAKYKLACSNIPKSMSTLMMGIMCYLHDSEAFENANRTINLESWDFNRFCWLKNEMNQTTLNLLIPNATLFTVVRDPLSRFVSGFVDKCINEGRKCYGCYENVRCFVHRHYQNMLELSRSPDRPKDPNSLHHLSPQNWRSNMHNDLYNMTIFKYGSGDENERMTEQILEFFVNHGVPQHELIKVSEALRGGHTLHTTRGSSDADTTRQKLLESRDLMLKIIKMYYYDYILFGFKFPQLPSE